MRLLFAIILLCILGGLTAAQDTPPQAPSDQPPPDTSAAAQPDPAPPPPPATDFVPDPPPLNIPPPQKQLAYCVIIENRSGGVIRIVDPPAQFLLARPGEDIGKVVRPASQLNTESFHASLWGQPMTVVASAVNAIHIKAYNVADGQRAAVLTILPHELLTATLAGVPAQPRADALYTDIAGGHGLFGGSYPVLTGNPVSIYRDGQRLYFEDGTTALKSGDIIIIEVRTPPVWPQSLLIDNHEAGAVTLTGADGQATVCATVSKPVSGSGRFEGGVFCQPGGIRATHSGVLDLDFSPYGETGGLQFIPYAHSLSPELTYSQDSPPYGILSGLELGDLRGQAPVFSGYLYPQSGLEVPARLPRLSVCVRFTPSSQWQPVPSLRGREQLTALSAIRIDWLPPVAAEPAAEQPPAPVEAGPADQSDTEQAPPGYIPVEPPGFRGT